MHSPGTAHGAHYLAVMFERGDVRFILSVEHSSVLRGGRRPFSPLRITVLGQERGRFRPRNPLQKAPRYKEGKNSPTPPEVSIRPPQGKRPPFHPEQEGGYPRSLPA